MGLCGFFCGGVCVDFCDGGLGLLWILCGGAGSVGLCGFMAMGLMEEVQNSTRIHLHHRRSTNVSPKR